VPPRDPEAIANAIEQMITNRESMARMAQYNHFYAKENLLAPKVSKRLIDIYKRVIQQQVQGA